MEVGIICIHARKWTPYVPPHVGDKYTAMPPPPLCTPSCRGQVHSHVRPPYVPPHLGDKYTAMPPLCTPSFRGPSTQPCPGYCPPPLCTPHLGDKYTTMFAPPPPYVPPHLGDQVHSHAPPPPMYPLFRGQVHNHARSRLFGSGLHSQ